MAYTLPDFMHFCNWWLPTEDPTVDPPQFAVVPCQIYVNTRGLLDIVPGDPLSWVPPIWIRMPFGSITFIANGICEAPHNSGDFFKSRWMQIVHQGFANQYMVALVEQCNVDGTTPKTYPL